MICCVWYFKGGGRAWVFHSLFGKQERNEDEGGKKKVDYNVYKLFKGLYNKEIFPPSTIQ